MYYSQMKFLRSQHARAHMYVCTNNNHKTTSLTIHMDIQLPMDQSKNKRKWEIWINVFSLVLIKAKVKKDERKIGERNG